jgi:putative membrane protein
MPPTPLDLESPATPLPAVKAMPSTRYPGALLVVFAAWWLVLAIAPRFRQDWLLENLLVFIAIPLLVLGYRGLRLSNLAYTLLFEVPYDDWARSLTGISASDALGLERNHYDRIMHFLYGLLVTPAAIELLDARAPQRGPWRWLLPLLFMISHSTIYELVEWCAAEVFGGDLGQAYLGTQGDVWDGQKDSALAALGALTAVVWRRWKAG